MKVKELIQKLQERYEPEQEVCSVLWLEEDVQQQAQQDKIECSVMQAETILNIMEQNHDAESGISWGTISSHLENLEQENRQEQHKFLEQYGFEYTVDMGGSYWEKILGEDVSLCLGGDECKFHCFDKIIGSEAGESGMMRYGLTEDHWCMADVLEIPKETILTQELIESFIKKLELIDYKH